ncbi:helix-turn-helix domain-containing protein [bacterium]|nr:helix-turn-helix domain-containing protein [bacterium]
MKLNELMRLIEKNTEKPINQSILAKSLGITRQTVSNRIKNDSQVTVEELKRAEKYFKIDLSNDKKTSDTGIVYLDYYPDVFASCGEGNIIFSNEKKKLAVHKTFIEDFSERKTYSIINATGNSMTPTIEPDDKLIVEHWDDSQIQDNKIYVFSFNNELFIKRLAKNFDEIIIKSDNPEYRLRTINGSTMNELQVIGKIIGIIKSL